MDIGDHVIIEPGCVVEGCIGDGTVLEAGAKVGRGAVVGKWCRVAPLGVVGEGECVGDGEIVLGGALGRRKDGVSMMGRDVRRVVGAMRGECEAGLLTKSGRTVRITDNGMP